MSESKDDGSCSTPTNINDSNSDWRNFLLQREKRKQLIKQKKDKQNEASSPTTTIQSHHPHITSRKLQKSSIYSPSSSSSSEAISNNDNNNNNNNNNDLNNKNNGKWTDLYEDVIFHICSFLCLFDLENVSICCRIWNKYTSFLDETKWRLWYNCIQFEIKNISSLDRTGKSNHFIITQNAFDSYDSVYHFSKFSKFSKYLLQINNNDNYVKNDKKNDTLNLFESLFILNNNSKSMIKLFIDKLHKNIINEFRDKSKDDQNQEKEISKSLSLANPELIYINNSYDTASDTETSIDIIDDDNDDIIIIDDNEYNHNDKDIILIRNNIKNIVKIYKYLKFCIKKCDYLKLLYLFKNIILIESRPILRWFLFIMDRSQCFGQKELLLNNDKNINIGDITCFLKYLENYIREIHSIININKQQTTNGKLIKYFNNHQQYLLKMCVDIDEIRARGISSLKYWMASGTMICNPDL